MRQQNATGPSAPKLAALLLGAVVAGCAAQPTTTTYSGPPTVTRIYAVDLAVGDLPDVMLYSNQSDKAKVSPKMPSSFSALRVEFDRPMSGASMVTNGGFPDLETGASGPPSGSYCAPLASPVIGLVDVDTPANDMSKKASICYDSSSALLGNPSVLIVLGQSAATDPASVPFTCNATSIDEGAAAGDASVAYGAGVYGLGGDVWLPNHAYGIKFAASGITDNAGTNLVTPTDTGWASGQFSITTMGFEVIGIAFQDPNTGYYEWLEKTPGLAKDLDAVGADAFVVPWVPTNEAAAFAPAFDAPVLVFYSTAYNQVDDPVRPDVFGGPSTTPYSVTRSDDSDMGGYAIAHIIGAYTAGLGYIGDQRVVEVYPSQYWESNITAKVTIPAASPSLDGLTLGTDKTFTFKTATTDPVATPIYPVPDSIGQVIVPGSGNASQNAVIAFQEPVDPSLIDSDHFIFASVDAATGAETVITGTSVGVWDIEGQEVAIKTPAPSILTPDTTYKVKWTGIKSVLTGIPNAGKDIPDGSYSFHTATYRSDNVYEVSKGTLIGIDRHASIDPTLLPAGAIVFRLLAPPDVTTVTTDSVGLNELVTDPATGLVTATAVDKSKYTITQQGADTVGHKRTFFVKVTDSTYPLKFGQRYQLHFATTIKDATSGQLLRAEGCTTGDCSDARTFITSTVQPYLRWDEVDLQSGAFILHFKYDSYTAKTDVGGVNGAASTSYIDLPTAHDTNVTDTIKLYTVGTGGSLTAAAVTCTALDAADTSVKTTCTPSAALPANTGYLISAAFTTDSPLKAAPTVSGRPTDSASALFVGSVTKSFTTACP